MKHLFTLLFTLAIGVCSSQDIQPFVKKKLKGYFVFTYDASTEKLSFAPQFKSAQEAVKGIKTYDPYHIIQVLEDTSDAFLRKYGISDGQLNSKAGRQIKKRMVNAQETWEHIAQMAMANDSPVILEGDLEVFNLASGATKAIYGLLHDDDVNLIALNIEHKKSESINWNSLEMIRFNGDIHKIYPLPFKQMADVPYSEVPDGNYIVLYEDSDYMAARFTIKNGEIQGSMESYKKGEAMIMH